MMKSLGSLMLAALLYPAIGFTSVPAAAQTPHALTSAEEAMARRSEETSLRDRITARFRDKGIGRLADTPAGRARKSVVVSVLPVGSAATVGSRLAARRDAAQARRALVTRFDYASGLTTRTWIDVATGTTVATREDLNYPTPLADEELAEAKALLRSKVPEFDQLVRDGGARVEYFHLVPVHTEASSPRYGHRVVWLWLVKPAPSDTYLVDLTTDEVERVR